MATRRMVNAYLSSIISISLVLFLIGIASLLIVSARSVTDYFRETMQVSVLMNPEVTDEGAAEYAAEVQKEPFVKGVKVIPREEGIEELREMLGEDFLGVFESSPVPVAVDITLQAEYVSSDSLAKVLPLLKRKDVDEVSCPQSLVDALNSNIAMVSLVMSVFIALMLFISYVLIGNTVRISVFSRRFVIHTMKLVGATRAFITAPFIKAAVIQGLIASVIALASLAGLVFGVAKNFPQLIKVFSVSDFAVTGAAVVLSGVAICVISTWFTVKRLVAMHRNELYF